MTAAKTPASSPTSRGSAIPAFGHNNFGAGSSREAAVWGMFANDIRVIVARSFADICGRTACRTASFPSSAAEDAQAFEQRVIAVDGAVPFTVVLQRAAHQRPRRAPMWRAIPNFPKAHAKCCSQSSPASARHARRGRSAEQLMALGADLKCLEFVIPQQPPQRASVSFARHSRRSSCAGTAQSSTRSCTGKAATIPSCK